MLQLNKFVVACGISLVSILTQAQDSPRLNANVDSSIISESTDKSTVTIEQLQRQLDEQNAQLQQLYQALEMNGNNGMLTVPSTIPSSPPVPYYNLLSAPEEPGGGAFIPVQTSSKDVGVLIYGRISVDSTFSDGRLLAPFGYIFLAPDTPESQWTNAISARQSTLGFLFTGPKIGNMKTLARFETYFLSNVTDANVYGLAQYFLYAKIYNEDWAFICGVTSALVNPRSPSVFNPAAGSNFGNLGFQRPQLRVERYLNANDFLFITPQFALTSPVGTEFFQAPTSGPSGTQLGEENGWPNIESRLAVGLGEKPEGSRFHPLEFGFSGAVGELRFSRSDFVNPTDRFTTLVWLYGADFRWQMTEKWAFTAEGFYGNALGSYAAGNKQTFNTETGEGVRACGGFMELEFKPNSNWITHLGYMVDDPLDKDVSSDGRTRQQNIYSNVMYVHNRYFQIGCEAAYLSAGFNGTNRQDNEAWVLQNKMTFTF